MTMGLLDHATSHTDNADLIILAHVETIRDQLQPATPSAVASLIGGAPVRDIRQRLANLHHLDLIAIAPEAYSWQLTLLGAELLRRELIGWSPSIREERRRDAELTSAAVSSRRRIWRR